MADKSDIGWTGATWNIITGCAIKSPACRLCYAMDLAGTRLKNHPSRIGLTKVVNGMHVWTGEVRFNEGWLLQPLQWSKPREIFVVAHGDLFYEEVPDEWIDEIFAVMALAHWHTFQTLTKRSARMHAYLNDPATVGRIYDIVCDMVTELGLDVVLIADPRHEKMAPSGKRIYLGQWPLPNVHGGVSAERQREADERIPDLLASPFAKRYVSAEPLLEEIDFFNRGWLKPLPNPQGAYIDQIITGGESGRGKRRPVPTHVNSFRSVRDQCARSHTAFFHKQSGSWIHSSQFLTDLDIESAEKFYWKDGSVSYLVGTGAAGALLDGVAHEGRPTC